MLAAESPHHFHRRNRLIAHLYRTAVIQTERCTLIVVLDDLGRGSGQSLYLMNKLPHGCLFMGGKTYNIIFPIFHAQEMRDKSRQVIVPYKIARCKIRRINAYCLISPKLLDGIRLPDATRASADNARHPQADALNRCLFAQETLCRILRQPICVRIDAV